MGEVIDLQPRLSVLACDDCGSTEHIIHLRRGLDIMVIVALSCAHCGKTIDFDGDKDAA
jgi:hypothetical protein